jgi:hypothetical protein
MTSSKPFEDEDTREVKRWYDRELFPDIRGVLCGDVMKKCWNEVFESGEEVLESRRQKQIARANVKVSIRWLLLFLAGVCVSAFITQSLHKAYELSEQAWGTDH